MAKTYWWTTPRRIIQPILRVNDGAVDGRKMVDELHAMGCDTILQNAGGIFAWHPTKNPYHRSPPGMKGNVLGDIMDQAHRLGMKVMVRYDLSGLRKDAYDDHPEWFYVDSQGQPMVDKGFFATCPSGGYYDDFFYPIFDELCETEQIDGIFFNMFGYRDRDRRGIYHGPCHCAACQKHFAEMYGLPLPTRENWDDPNYFKYLAFREQMYLKQATEIYQYIKAKSDDIGVFEGRGTRAPLGLLAGHADVTEVETHWAIANRRQVSGEREQGFPGGRWRYTPGETCRMVRTFGANFGSTINIFQAGGGRFEAHSRGWMAMALSQAVANGGWPYVAFIGEPWLEDRKTKKQITDFYKFLEKNESCFRNLRSAAQIAILVSDNNAVKRHGRLDAPEVSQVAYRGWYNVLVKAHMEFDVLDETQVRRDAGILRRYGLLILPNLALLSDAACRAIDEYVAGGGRMVATHETSRFDDSFRRREGFGLASLGAGVVSAQRSLLNAYLRNPGDKRFPSLTETGLLSLSGGYLYVVPRAGAECSFTLVGEIEHASPELEYIETETGYPGIVWHKHGKGRTAYFPWDIERLAHLYGLEDHNKLMEETVRHLVGEDLILSVQAPSWVEATLHKQDKEGRWILQLVNESGQDGAEFRDPIRISGITVSLKAERVKSVRALWSGVTLEFTQGENGTVTFTAPPLDLYELVVIE